MLCVQYWQNSNLCWDFEDAQVKNRYELYKLTHRHWCKQLSWSETCQLEAHFYNHRDMPLLTVDGNKAALSYFWPLAVRKWLQNKLKSTILHVEVCSSHWLTSLTLATEKNMGIPLESSFSPISMDPILVKKLLRGLIDAHLSASAMLICRFALGR